MTTERRRRTRVQEKPSKATFWVRRLVALLILALLISVVIFAVKSFASWKSAADDSRQQAAEKSANAKVASDPQACKIVDLNYSVTPKEKAGKVGEKTVFDIKLVNNSQKTPCTIDGSIHKVGFILQTGNDQVFDSTKCNGQVKEQKLLLGTNMEYNSTIEWDGRVYEACKAKDFAQAGSYRIIPILDGKQQKENGVYLLK